MIDSDSCESDGLEACRPLGEGRVKIRFCKIYPHWCIKMGAIGGLKALLRCQISSKTGRIKNYFSMLRVDLVSFNTFSYKNWLFFF